MRTKEDERRARARQYVEHLVRSIPTQPQTPIKQFLDGDVVVQAWNRLSVDGVRYQSFTVGRLVQKDGEPGVKPDLYSEDLRHARQALRELIKWWREEQKRSRPPLWKRLVSLITL